MNEIELILSDICGCSRAELYRDGPSKVLNDVQLKRLEKILQQRAHSIPVQYGLGHADFMGLVLKVNKHVLIPRPETEQLAECAFELIAKKKTTQSPYRILDIGTGSGCIAIALAKIIKRDVAIIATDISAQALEVARGNAQQHAVGNRIQFVQSDLFGHSRFTKEEPFDLIISNPPYVPTHEIGAFDVTTTSEPVIALDGGFDGCDIYRRLSSEALPFLKKDGCFIFEIGEGQSDRICDMFSGDWVVERFIKDYGQVERFCVVRPKE